MKEMFVDRAAIELESEKLKKLKAVKKRNLKDAWHDLRAYAGEILHMAVECGFSRRHIANILESRHKISVSHNRIYNFVRDMNGGNWPPKKNSEGK